MKALSFALIAVAGLLLPAPALADDCAHSRDVDLALQLDGVATVAFEAGAHDLLVRGTPGTAAGITGRACAWSAEALEGMRVEMERRGDTLVVRLESNGDRRWGLFGSRYATFDLAAAVPAGLSVELSLGSGDARVTGVAALDAGVGSGDLEASGIDGEVVLGVGSGDVALRDIGSLRVGSIGSGDVSVARVRGGVDVGSIGSGDFELTGAGGDVEVGSIGSGDLQARDVRGALVVGSVGSGDVSYRDIGGRVSVPNDD